MGTPNTIKYEIGKVFCGKGDFKNDLQAMYTRGRNYTNATSVSNALSRRKFGQPPKTTRREKTIHAAIVTNVFSRIKFFLKTK